MKTKNLICSHLLSFWKKYSYYVM